MQHICKNCINRDAKGVLPLCCVLGPGHLQEFCCVNSRLLKDRTAPSFSSVMKMFHYFYSWLLELSPSHERRFLLTLLSMTTSVTSLLLVLEGKRRGSGAGVYSSTCVTLRRAPASAQMFPQAPLTQFHHRGFLLQIPTVLTNTPS